MDFNQHFKISWSLMRQHIVPLIIITLILFGISLITFGLLAPALTAGYTHSLLRLIRENREPKVNDLFSQMKLFLPLLCFTFAAFILIGIGYLILFLPGLALTFGLAFCCTYLLPLLVDRDINLLEAIKESFRLATTGEIMDHLVLVIIYFGIMAIGSSVFIGSLLTTPFATLLLLLSYEERATGNSYSVIKTK